MARSSTKVGYGARTQCYNGRNDLGFRQLFRSFHVFLPKVEGSDRDNIFPIFVLYMYLSLYQAYVLQGSLFSSDKEYRNTIHSKVYIVKKDLFLAIYDT